MSVPGGSNAETATSTARYNKIYTVGVCNSVSPGNLGFTEAAGAEDEGTVIVDPRGTMLAKVVLPAPEGPTSATTCAGG